jgi:citrate lyase subunit beta / citryl-CoA lyase
MTLQDSAILSHLAKGSSAPVSYLFVPGNRPERFGKALASGADQVIIDLEDAVAPADKLIARDAVRASLDPEFPAAVRINSADSEWFEQDLSLCGLPGVAAVVLPKAASVADIARVRAAGAPTVLALIESAEGIVNARALAAADGVTRLMFGSIDFSVDLGIEGDERELDAFRSELVLASRMAGISAPIDGVTTAIDDVELLRRETLRGKRFGFGGKLCIHPKQLAVVHDAYLPSNEEVHWAMRVLEAAKLAGGGAVAVDGKMVDKPVMMRAERILQAASRLR